jgi:hypothetical protein
MACRKPRYPCCRLSKTLPRFSEMFPVAFTEPSIVQLGGVGKTLASIRAGSREPSCPTRTASSAPGAVRGEGRPGSIPSSSQERNPTRAPAAEVGLEVHTELFNDGVGFIFPPTMEEGVAPDRAERRRHRRAGGRASPVAPVIHFAYTSAARVSGESSAVWRYSPPRTVTDRSDPGRSKAGDTRWFPAAKGGRASWRTWDRGTACCPRRREVSRLGWVPILPLLLARPEHGG